MRSRSLLVFWSAVLLLFSSLTVQAQNSSLTMPPSLTPTESSASLSSQLVQRLIERVQQATSLQLELLQIASDSASYKADSITFKASMTGFSALLDMQVQTVASLQSALVETSNLLGDSKQALGVQQQATRKVQDDALSLAVEVGFLRIALYIGVPVIVVETIYIVGHAAGVWK